MTGRHPTREAKIVVNILRGANLLSRTGGKLAAQVGLSSVKQWLLLGTVAEFPDISLSELRQNLRVTKQDITGMVDRLQQGGFVITQTDAGDRRVTHVRLTVAGREVLGRLDLLAALSNQTIFALFSAVEMTTLEHLLERLVDHLSEISPD